MFYQGVLGSLEAPSANVRAARGTPSVTRILTRTVYGSRHCTPGVDQYRQWDLPWGSVNPRCVPKNPATGDPFDGAELEDLCELPCVMNGPNRTIPTLADGDEAALNLTIKVGHGVQNPKMWENLIQCSWALLHDNLDLVEFAACVATGNRELAGCLKLQILWDIPDIRVWDTPHGQIGATVFPWDDLLAYLPTLFLGFFSTEAWRPDDLILFADPDLLTDSGPTDLFGWGSSDPTGSKQSCACATMAMLLLHELVHVCGEDLNDWHTPNESCDLADVVASNFSYMLAKRYTDISCSQPWFWYSGATYKPFVSLEDGMLSSMGPLG